MPVLLSARDHPYRHPYMPLISPLGPSTESLDYFFQEADMDFFFMGGNSLPASFANVVSMSATGLLIGGANVLPNLR